MWRNQFIPLVLLISILFSNEEKGPFIQKMSRLYVFVLIFVKKTVNNIFNMFECLTPHRLPFAYLNFSIQRNFYTLCFIFPCAIFFILIPRIIQRGLKPLEYFVLISSYQSTPRFIKFDQSLLFLCRGFRATGDPRKTRRAGSTGVHQTPARKRNRNWSAALVSLVRRRLSPVPGNFVLIKLPLKKMKKKKKRIKWKKESGKKEEKNWEEIWKYSLLRILSLSTCNVTRF